MKIFRLLTVAAALASSASSASAQEIGEAWQESNPIETVSDWYHGMPLCLFALTFVAIVVTMTGLLTQRNPQGRRFGTALIFGYFMLYGSAAIVIALQATIGAEG